MSKWDGYKACYVCKASEGRPCIYVATETKAFYVGKVRFAPHLGRREK